MGNKSKTSSIVIYSRSYQQFENLFKENARDNCTEPFIKLKSTLEELGYSIEFAGKQSVGSIKNVIFWDGADMLFGKNPKRIIKYLLDYYWVRKVKKELNTIQVLWEGRANGNYRFKKKHHKGYKKLLTWNDSFVDNEQYFKFYLPVVEEWPVVVNVAFDKKKLLTNISYNKFSKHPRELYSKRVETIRYFDSCFKNNFDLYGHGWSNNTFSTYKGTVENKYEIFPAYKFGLCYENFEGVKGYITEKIFDCMRSNCVPIYWGASNIDEYVDKDAFIDRRKFNSNRELAEYLNSVTEVRYNEYLAKINGYLRTQNFKRFLSSSFVDNIIYHLGL